MVLLVTRKHGQAVREPQVHYAPLARLAPSPRSEEHTSELQSPCNLVCRLLLEKKKNLEHSEADDHERRALHYVRFRYSPRLAWSLRLHLVLLRMSALSSRCDLYYPSSDAPTL